MPRRRLPQLANRYSGVLDANACCSECDWGTYSRKNALALASQHARRTGHQVSAEQTISVMYNRKDGVDPPMTADVAPRPNPC